MKAVNKFPGYEHVKVSLETIPRTRPISFTKLRDVLKNPNATPEQQYAVWAQGFNAQQLGKDWILHLMDISRKGMGITAQPASPQPAPVAEVRLFNALVRPSLLENKTNEEAAGVGVIASKKQAKDPRYSMSLTKDVRPGQIRKNLDAFSLEDTSQALAHTAKSLENPPKVMQHRARRDMERDQQLKGRDIAKRNEEFNSEYDDEAGMAQSNLRTMARAVDGLLKTIKNNDNLPEWGQEKIAKAEMMLVSVWDYLQSQKELGMDPKVNESRALAGLKQIVAELSSEKLGQYKKAAGAQASAADKAGNTKKADKRFSGIVKATKKQFANDEKGVAEGLSKRDQKDVDAIRAAIARLEAQLNHPNADRDAIQQSIAHEKKRLALYSVTEGAPIVVAQAPIDVRNPKKAPQPYRNQGDIVPDTKPPSTEKRGVKGRPGQRPMPDHSVAERMLPKSAFAGSDKNKLGPAAHAKGKQKGPVKQGQFVGGMEEGVGSKLAGLGLAGAMALGSAGANARVTPGDDPNINRLTGKPNVTQVAPSDVKPAASAGFNKEWLQKAADPNRTGRYMISVEKAQELLNKMNAVDEAKKKGADGKACWKNYRYAGTENGKDKCVPVGEDVENIMGALIENLIRK
jgi:hypothetical protein